MSHDVFICHSSKDRAIANAIASTLEQERIRCWIAPRDVVPGSDYAQSIVEAISGSKLTVLVFSDQSNHSTHVRREIERSVSHGIPILPFRVEDVVPSPSLEYFISDAHWLDAVTPPIEQHLHHLAGTVRLLLDRDREPATGAGAPTALAGGLPPPAVEPPHIDLAPREPTPAHRGRTKILAGAAAVVGVLVIGLVALAGRGGGDERVDPADGGAAATTAPAQQTIPVDEPEEEPTGETAPAPTTEVPATTVLPETTEVPEAEPPETTDAPETTMPPAEPVLPEEPELRAPVDALSSFAFTESLSFDWDGGSVTMIGDGVFVAPDRQSCTTTTTMAGMTVEARAIVVDGRAWYDDGFGSGLVEVDPDDSMLQNMLAGCASSDEMWAGDWSDPPEGGETVTIDGRELIAFDVSKMSTSWSAVFGLPPGVTADTMVLYAAPDLTWVAGMDASIAASAETFRTYFGFPPTGVEGDCHMSMSVMVEQPDDPSLTITPPS